MKLMRSISFLLFIMICTASYANKNEPTDVKAHKITKLYIDPNNIRFDEKNIYVYINQSWVKTSGIFTDELGFYIVNEQGTWTCPKCGWRNTDPYQCKNPRGCDYCRIEN